MADRDPPSAADQDLPTFFYYDDAGRQAAVKAPTLDRATFAVTRYLYDADGRLWKEIRNCTNTGGGIAPPPDPATCDGGGTADADTNVVTEFGYDAMGNRTAVIAPDPSATSGTGTSTTRSAYDADGRLCRVLENATVDLQTLADPCVTAVSGTTSQDVSTRYTYDGSGNLASMIDGRGKTTSYVSDASGRMTGLSDPDGQALGWAYDALGRRTSQTNRQGGATVTWTYDGAARMTSRTADGVTVTYTYDATGNRLTAAAPAGTITTTYDRLNRPLAVSLSTDAAATTTYAYGLTTATRTDPTGSYAITLDAFERTVSTTDPIHGAATFGWTYRADGQPASLSAPNANSTAFGFDDLGRPTTKATTGTGGVARAAYTWTLNRAGQILSEASTISSDPTNGTTGYTYDPLARLSGSTRAGTATAYGWQAVPNRASVQVGTNPAVTTSFDDANRPTTDSAGGAYSSDLDGRLTVRPGQRLEWDSLGRLTRVRPPQGNSTIATYTYDVLDRLLLADYGGSNRVRFRYVGLTTAVAQTVDDPSGSVLRHVGSAPSGARLLDWTGTGQSQRFTGTNGHHDVTWTADGTGAVTATLRYDPWGTLTSSTGASLPDLRFQGSWYDPATDLAWVVTRWYAPALGRFVSEDSLLGEPAQPASRHLYAYGAGEPVGRWDPDGQYWYRLTSDATWVELGYERLGSASRWPMLWNANRGRFSREPSPYGVLSHGTCIYVPTEWLVSSEDQARFKRLSNSSCSGLSYVRMQIPAGMKRLWLDQAQGKIGIGNRTGLFSFTRTKLWARTDEITERPRNPSSSQWASIRENVGDFNRASRSRLRYTPYVEYMNDWWIARSGGAPYWCGSSPCTEGQFVFMQGYSQTRSALGHEYIHVLQYEGRGYAFHFGYVVDYVACWCSGADNASEALAYIWSFWLETFSSEVPPWAVWRRPPSDIGH